MDTTETYIKMRIAAIPDLGTGTKPYESHLTPPNAWVDVKGDFFTHTYQEPYYCQLERQDQLQEMVDGDYIEFLSRLFKFAMRDYMKPPQGKVDPAFLHFYSMEQLWLAFVMKEKYNKVWNGEEWLRMK